MEKLKPIIGRGSISTTSGTISAVAGVGSVEQIQAVSGTGATSPVKGRGGINGK
jgi:hypothetical protein